MVAGASGTRSEFNGDFAWSDYVVQKGYAYASQNKGVLNLQSSTPADPLACPAPLGFHYVRPFLRQRSRPAFHTLGRFHGQGGGTRARRREGGLRPSATLHLRGGDLEWRLPSAPGGGDRAEALRRRGRLGRHLRRRTRIEHPHRPAAGDPEFPAIRVGHQLPERHRRRR